MISGAWYGFGTIVIYFKFLNSKPVLEVTVSCRRVRCGSPALCINSSIKQHILTLLESPTTCGSGLRPPDFWKPPHGLGTRTLNEESEDPVTWLGRAKG